MRQPPSPMRLDTWFVAASLVLYVVTLGAWLHYFGVAAGGMPPAWLQQLHVGAACAGMVSLILTLGDLWTRPGFTRRGRWGWTVAMIASGGVVWFVYLAVHFFRERRPVGGAG